MKRAVKEDKNLVIDILAQAFDDNKSVNYIVRQDDKRKQRIRALMDYSFEVCNRFGEVWMCEKRHACALILYPHLKKTTLASVWLDIKLIFQAVGLSGIGKTLAREAKIKQIQPKEKMLYLWFIAVNPFYQHQGNGSKLLSEVMAHAVKGGLPVYLETSTLQNLPWYKNFGFQVYSELALSYPLYFLSNPSKMTGL
jgi:GNAT superfamily N-acetyltransferase